MISPPWTRRDAVRAVAALALGSAPGCRRVAAPDSLREIKVSFVPRITVSSLFVADEQGYFRSAGLKLAPQPVRRNENLVPLLTGGALDVGFVQISPALINAIANGAHVRIVAGRDTASRTCGAMGVLYGKRKNFPNGLDDVRLLKGKRVSVSSPLQQTAFYLNALLASAGMTEADIHVVYLEQNNSVAALMSGDIDVASGSYLDSVPAMSSPDIVKGIGLADVFPGMQYNFVAFGPTLLDHDRRTGTAFLSALFQGVRAFTEGKFPRAFLESLGGQFGIDPELAVKQCRSSSVLDARIDEPSVARLVDWAVRKGFSPKRVPVADLIDTSFRDAMLAGRNGA